MSYTDIWGLIRYLLIKQDTQPLELNELITVFSLYTSTNIFFGQDFPAEDIGVGPREMGYLFGQYRRLSGHFQVQWWSEVTDIKNNVHLLLQVSFYFQYPCFVTTRHPKKQNKGTDALEYKWIVHLFPRA